MFRGVFFSMLIKNEFHKNHHFKLKFCFRWATFVKLVTFLRNPKLDLSDVNSNTHITSISFLPPFSMLMSLHYRYSCILFLDIFSLLSDHRRVNGKPEFPDRCSCCFLFINEGAETSNSWHPALSIAFNKTWDNTGIVFTVHPLTREQKLHFN